MTIHKLYSQRKRDAEKDGSEVFVYDKIPQKIRAQIKFIWEEAIGPYYEYFGFEGNISENNAGWKCIRRAVCKSKGRLSLSSKKNPKEDCEGFLFAEQNIDEWLDLIEYTFQYISEIVPTLGYLPGKGITQKPKVAVQELNQCFFQAGMGYQFENGQIIRVDNQMIHSEIVKPTLKFLNDPRFSGPQDEFLSAHAHFRKGEFKDANTDALNAFESTLKTVCDIKGWSYQKGARASDLLKILREKKFFPDYLDKSFDQLIATLKTGLPKVRNEEGAHGQGSKPKKTPPYIAGYALHLAAAKILLLSEILKESEK